jgi:hypothetical protein
MVLILLFVLSTRAPDKFCRSSSGQGHRSVCPVPQVSRYNISGCWMPVSDGEFFQVSRARCRCLEERSVVRNSRSGIGVHAPPRYHAEPKVRPAEAVM